MADAEFLKRLHSELLEKGLLIEAGWVGLRIAALPPNASKAQLDDMRGAFFAGAQHLFTCILNILDPGEEATDEDLHKMELISQELVTFITEFERKHGLRPSKDH